jgi:hypothetical protein
MRPINQLLWPAGGPAPACAALEREKRFCAALERAKFCVPLEREINRVIPSDRKMF